MPDQTLEPNWRLAGRSDARNGRLQLLTNTMIPYEIAWTPRCTERRRTGTMPDEKRLLRTASLLRIFVFRISGWNLRNRTRDGGNNNGQICDTQNGYLRNSDALRLKRAVMEEIRGEKNKRRSSRIDERYLDIGQSPEMPERKRTVTPIVLQILEKWQRKIRNRGAEAAQADSSPDSRIGGSNSNYGVRKRGNTRPG